MTAMTVEQSSTSEFHDRLAPGYEAAMERDPGNVWVRAAFRELVVETVEPGCALLDFGCGTGADSRWYAARGHKVVAYDNSDGMIAELCARSVDEVGASRIVPFGGDYEVFLHSLNSIAPCRAVAANFAVLNMIPGGRPLFVALGNWLSPGAVVIVSVLNPFHWRDLKRPGHFGIARDCVKSGSGIRRGEVVTYFHSCSQIVQAARPEFTLEQWAGVGGLVSIERGRYDWSAPAGWAQRFEKRFWRSPIGARAGKFWFLVFRRNP